MKWRDYYWERRIYRDERDRECLGGITFNPFLEHWIAWTPGIDTKMIFNDRDCAEKWVLSHLTVEV